MKRFFILILISISWSCNDPDAPECFKTAGDRISKTTDMPSFTTMEVNGDFNIILSDEAEQKVGIAGHENILENVTFEVKDDQLIITDHNGCDWVRSYDMPQINIASPNVSRIKQNGSGLITSQGKLSYPSLTLVTANYSGDYRLSFDNKEVIISSNDLSNFYLSGNTDRLTVGFFAGDGRCECADIQAREVSVFHRGTNDVTVHATGLLSGRILSTGNIIYVKTKPDKIDVGLENRGHLIDGTD